MVILALKIWIDQLKDILQIRYINPTRWNTDGNFRLKQKCSDSKIQDIFAIFRMWLKSHVTRLTSVVSSPGVHTQDVHCWRPTGNSIVNNLRRFFTGGTPEVEDPSYAAVPSTFDVSLFDLILSLYDLYFHGTERLFCFTFQSSITLLKGQ